ncbi:MAG: TolC family protein [Aquificota bacterium]|nr:TolC family protein [Aquificota bacterium]
MLAVSGFGITLEEALDLAVKKNPEIRALESEIRRFDGLERAAYAFPNPELDFESGFITTDRFGRPEGRVLYLLELSQPVPLWGVREKGRAVVREEREAFLREVEARKREILGEVYRAFYEALFRKEVVRIWEENLRTAEEVEEFVERSYDLGEATLLELLRARRERDLAEVRLRIARAELETALQDLSRLLNTEVEDVEGDLEGVRDIREVDLEDLPSVVALKRRIKAVERDIELQRALARPTLDAGFQIEDSEEGYYGLRATFRVGLPVFYRRQGEILERIALKEALKSRLEGEVLRIDTRLRSIRIRFSALLKELRRIEERVIPRAEEELKLALRSYRLKL